jgi:transposase-like protein
LPVSIATSSARSSIPSAALQARWPDGIACPVCGVIGESKRIATRLGKLQCSCGSQFSMFRKTPLSHSKLPLTVWVPAMYLMASGAKSVTERTLATQIGVCVKTG